MDVVAAGSIVPVKDLRRTYAFYSGVLGFTGTEPAEGEIFLTMRRDRALIHFIETDDEAVLETTATNMSNHIWLEDLDAFYTTVAPELERLAPGRARPPFDQPYGQREFHVKDPDGFLMFFSQAPQSMLQWVQSD